MRLIGLTGGIATGKSYVAGLLAERGAAIVDADALAREVVLPGTAAHADVVEAFGPDVLGADGALDRGALGVLVFADPGRRAELERITHPRINTLMQERVLAALQSPAPLVVADIPLLFERSRQHGFDGTLLVYAPATVQRARLVERNGLAEDEAERRLAAQLPIDDKRALATWVIDNGGSRTATEAQVDAWWQEVVGEP